MPITFIEDIEKQIIKDFNSECNDNLLKEMIENFKRESLLNNCMIFADWNRCFYRDNLYRIIRININYFKEIYMTKLILARCFYSLCGDKDILDMIHESLERRPIIKSFD